MEAPLETPPLETPLETVSEGLDGPGGPGRRTSPSHASQHVCPEGVGPPVTSESEV